MTGPTHYNPRAAERLRVAIQDALGDAVAAAVGTRWRLPRDTVLTWPDIHPVTLAGHDPEADQDASTFRRPDPEPVDGTAVTAAARRSAWTAATTAPSGLELDEAARLAAQVHAVAWHDEQARAARRRSLADGGSGLLTWAPSGYPSWAGIDVTPALLVASAAAASWAEQWLDDQRQRLDPHTYEHAMWRARTALTADPLSSYRRARWKLERDQ